MEMQYRRMWKNNGHWTRMIHLRYNHITKFYEIDQKLPPKDITKNAYLKLL